jgi:peptide/nickel transport system permease protein
MTQAENTRQHNHTEGGEAPALASLAWIAKDKRVLIAGGFVVLLYISAIAAPILTTSDPQRIVGGDQTFLAPGDGGLMGTDEFGRDIFARLLYGARLTLGVSLASVGIALSLGVTAGMIAGYFGNPVDMILMRSADAILSFPPILLAIFLVTFWGTSILNVILVIGILYTPRFARVTYATTLSVKELDFIEASRALGATPGRIIVRGILPNIVAPILVQISLLMGTAIILESSLSFLGLGPADMASWGRSIQQSSRFLASHPWGVIWPALAISSTVLALNILGDGLRDRLDPRER